MEYVGENDWFEACHTLWGLVIKPDIFWGEFLKGQIFNFIEKNRTFLDLLC